MYPARRSSPNTNGPHRARPEPTLRLVPPNRPVAETVRSIDPFFGSIRQASPRIVTAVIVTHLLLKLVIFSQFFLKSVALPVEAATGGIITPVTLAGSISTVVLVGVLMMVVGSLRLSDLGFSRNDLKTGLVTVACLLIAVHLFAIVLLVAAGETFRVTPYPVGQLLLAISDAFLGAAVVEECLYRGFLLVQVYYLLSDHVQPWLAKTVSPSLLTSSLLTSSRGMSLVASIILTQAYFGINHIGSAMRMGLEAPVMVGYIFQCAFVGMMLAVVFIRTRSLAVAIVAHGMLNLSLSVIDVPFDTRMLTLVAVCLLMMCLPYIYHRDHRRFSLMWMASKSAAQTTGDVVCNSVSHPATSYR